MASQELEVTFQLAASNDGAVEPRKWPYAANM